MSYCNTQPRTIPPMPQSGLTYLSPGPEPYYPATASNHALNVAPISAVDYLAASAPQSTAGQTNPATQLPSQHLSLTVEDVQRQVRDLSIAKTRASHRRNSTRARRLSSSHSMNYGSPRQMPFTAEQTSPSDTGQTPNGSGQSMNDNEKALSGSDKASSDDQQSPDSNLLHADYKTRDNPRKFFVVGKVFYALWNEDGKGPEQLEQAADSSQGAISKAWTRNSYGCWIYSKPRRFIVVRVFGHHASCVPITSYGGQGVAKMGVQKSSHAIVYAGKRIPPPQPTMYEQRLQPGELAMLPYAIRVDLDKPLQEKLDPMSRIDFGKVQSIDFQCKVKSLGMVNRASEVHLQKQWHKTMGVSPAIENMQQPADSSARAIVPGFRPREKRPKDRVTRITDRLLEDGIDEKEIAAALRKLGKAKASPGGASAARVKTGEYSDSEPEGRHTPN